MIKIDSTSFGQVVINGQSFGDVLIVGGEIKPRRRIGSSHRIGLSEVEALLSQAPDVILIGTGQSGVLKVDSISKQRITASGAELIILPTPAAINKFNELVKTKRVNALIHTTC
jgi:hypothetical protein